MFGRFAASLLLLTLFASQSSANFVGTITGIQAGGGIAGTGGAWNGNNVLSLSWNVSQNMNGSWHYSYTFVTPSQGFMSHLILELSDGVTRNDILNYSGPAIDGTVRTFSPTDPGNSNPNMPAPIYGMKIGDASTASTTFSFDIFRAPVWGDFYAKDGNAGGGTNSAWNSGLGQVGDQPFNSMTYPNMPAVNDSYFFFGGFAKILRPNGPEGVVPAPPTVIMAAVGGLSWLGTVILRRRRSSAVSV